ncbi:MAG: hypothetical protein ACKUBY_03220 [Candidatus Moraniibacteriota bacterium]|jgi:hypothetical protein
MDDINTQKLIDILVSTDENMTPLIALFFICEYHNCFNSNMLTITASSLNVSDKLGDTAEYYMARGEFFNYMNSTSNFRKKQLINCIQD